MVHGTKKVESHWLKQHHSILSVVLSSPFWLAVKNAIAIHSLERVGWKLQVVSGHCSNEHPGFAQTTRNRFAVNRNFRKDDQMETSPLSCCVAINSDAEIHNKYLHYLQHASP